MVCENPKKFNVDSRESSDMVSVITLKGACMRIFLLMLMTLSIFFAGCGGGGGGGGAETPQFTLSLQESQRYFPFTDGNVWVSRVTDTDNGIVTASYTDIAQRVGSRMVGNVMTLVMSHTSLPSVTMNESYFTKDTTGIMTYGSDDQADTISAALVPYRLVSFPIQVGSSFRQVNKANIDFGQDLDGDGINEKIAITADVIVRGFESVTTDAGTFQNSLRIDTNVIETLTLSTNGSSITATGVECYWFAQDIGPVKQTTTIAAGGTSSGSTEELTGYMVDGRRSGLSLQVSPATATINAGSTVQMSVKLLDATNSELIAVPAEWSSGSSTIATVNAAGLVTGKKAGTVNITPSVGGVVGPSVSLSVLYGFSPGIRYPVPASLANFMCGNTAIGDLNGDGRNDVAVIEASGSRILVYYQNSTGTLDIPQIITAPLSLAGIAIRDINNDGLPDLVVSGNSSSVGSGWLGRVAIFSQNQTSHALDTAQEYTLSTNTAGNLEIADLNSDGLLDIIVASVSGSNGLLSFFFQGANGTLSSEFVYTAVPVASGGEIHVADMNSDGRNDVVVQSDLKQLAIIKQMSTGTYSTSPDYYAMQTSYWPFFKSFALGDLNGDGRTDIAVADPGNGGYLNIFQQNASGGLTGPNLLNFTGSTQDELKIADVDGDGLNDIIVLSTGYLVMLLRQSTSHTLQDYQTFYLPTQSSGGTFIHQAMSTGDITGDGLTDVIASWSNEGLFVLPGL